MILRKKLRYVLVEATDKVYLSHGAVADSLKKEIMSFLGQLSYFKANPQITTQFNENVFAMCVNRGYERNLILALCFVKNLEGREVGFYTIKTSGSMRSLRGFFSKNYGH